MQPPNIPLRAGPSGPFVNLATYLAATDGLVVVRRVWSESCAGAEQTIAGGSGPPGTDVAVADVVWTAEEWALRARLHYLIIWTAIVRANNAGYPTFVQACMHWEPAGGPNVAITNPTIQMVGTNQGSQEDFACVGELSYAALMRFGYPPPLSVGTNRIGLNISSSVGGDDIIQQYSSCVVAELLADAAQVSYRVWGNGAPT